MYMAIKYFQFIIICIKDYSKDLRPNTVGIEKVYDPVRGEEINGFVEMFSC